MAFEIKETDLLARIGRLKSKSGTVETPLLFPVINPASQMVSPRRMREHFGFEAVITNAYILRRHASAELRPNGLHDYLDFDGTIMTDSGAYQILVYGDVEVTPGEIIAFQENIGSDIATILDIPTAWKVLQEDARKTVDETLNRARAFLKQKTRDDILWVGPVQGGRYLDLVVRSSQEMGKLPFDIHALGSPTEVMERYRFDVLVDMIMAAKMNLPVQRPLHLFGAGHPFMFALAVALGCDLFDSAAYALYAKEGRYMTGTGTSRLDELEYFPCTCPKCVSTTPTELRGMSPDVIRSFLAEHNLYASVFELRKIKQAIKDGRLWEYLQMQSHSHPSLIEAFQKLKKYRDFLEKHDSSVKKSGLFFFDSTDLMRPEVVRHEKRLASNCVPPKSPILLLSPQTKTKPFHRSRGFRLLERCFKAKSLGFLDKVHVCFYAAPFGIIPYELDEVYPLSQHETISSPDLATADYVTDQIVKYILRTECKLVVLLDDPEHWGDAVKKKVGNVCSAEDIMFRCINICERQPAEIYRRLSSILSSQ